MQKLLTAILALTLTACATTGYQEPVVVTGNGQDPCPKAECVKHPIDPR